MPLIITLFIMLANLVSHYCASGSSDQRSQPWVTHRGTDQCAASGPGGSSKARIGAARNTAQKKHCQ
jgi:hypothetical protein